MSARSPIGRPIIGRPRRSPEYQTPVKTARGQHSRHRSAYDKDDVRLIPEVPRIPDRFLPHNEDHDSSPIQEYIQNTANEKKVSLLKLTPAPHTRYLPNCSFGKPKEVQVISNAMMQAYIAMRGNSMGGYSENDPLFEWIQQREELAQASKPKIHEKREVSRMLELIDKALESSNMGGDSPRDCVFEVYRPDFEHIKPPQDMDMSANVFSACCSDFEWTDDSDDEEAHVPSGRISPCTFLEWSQNCVRWNADENKKDTASHLRMRPPTPKVPVPPRRHGHAPYGYLEPQWDVNTGEELTPTYHVPSSPSIIYTPPGVEFTGFRTANFHQQYKRMAPLAERELRTKIYGGEIVPPQLSDDENDRFSPSEVNAATAAVPELYGRQGPEIEAAFRDQWAAVRRAEEAEKALYKHAEQQREHIAHLQYDQHHLNEFLPALHVRREMRDARAREQVEVQMRRGAKIRAYVAEHALEAQSRLDMAWYRLNCTQAKVSENMLRIASLENEVRELCFRGGVRDPEHAYAVLMGAESDASDGAPAHAGVGVDVNVNTNINVNDYGYGYDGAGGNGNGNGNGGPMGPWSPSSLGRAEEEYDRFLADMQMQNRGRADIREWEKRYDDDESRDSGVAGVGGCDRYRFQHQGPDGMGYRG
ncbi:hypothetical protein CHU98_g6878 [Xylaria longipes]|nr:hypothetical protein CHU98_g6878 [Xylaria longipes]